MLKVKEKASLSFGIMLGTSFFWGGGRGHESGGSRRNGLKLGLAEEQRDPVAAVDDRQLPGNTAVCCSLYDP